jgi:putative Mn2+ efflux pump MntP
MIAAVSVISVVLGAGVAYFADRYPAHIEELEASAGVLLIAGLALLGSGLPAVL